MAATTATNRRETLLSRNDIENLIAEGRKIVIVDGQVLKPDAWLPYHPGGDKAILHMVGRDATNEVKAFHSLEAQKIMQRYQIGRIEGAWEDFVPPIQGGKFRREAEMQEMKQEQAAPQDSSEEERSREPSPVFELSERREASLRKRRGSPGAASESSATSLDSIEVDAVTKYRKEKSLAEQRTEEEYQRDIELFPSLDPATQNDILDKYHQLDERIKAAGLYDCNYSAYFFEVLRYTTLAALSYYFFQSQHFVISAAFLGMLWHQLVFTVHDAGHMGITHDFQTDSLIGVFIADFLGGLSCCWWKQNHNVHHIVTNSAEHDPDIQHMPFFAISHRFFASLRSTYYDRLMTYDPAARLLLRFQHYLYYPILTFGRFNLYVLSWQYIFLGQGPRKGPARYHRHLEALGQAVFWFWFGYLTVYRGIPDASSRLAFVLISHMVTMPVHVQITLSHFAMSTADLGPAESFPQRMLRTTMDVACPPWLDFFHGGLQFQAVHHLFPRIPRHNLRACQPFVREFCEETGIPYTEYGFVEGNGKVISQLGEVARQARVMAECAGTMSAADAWEGH